MSNAEDIFSRQNRQEHPRIYTLGEPDEHCDKAGAEKLKDKIESYWRDRGAIVMCRLEPKGFTAALRAARYDIRSDMIGGLPRLRALPSKEPE